MSLRALGIASVFVALAALLPAAASADDCMCAFGADEPTPWSVLVDLIEMERGNVPASWMPAVAATQPRSSRNPAHVLWCVGGDDPTCSPHRHGHETPSAASLGSAPPGVLITLPPVQTYAGIRFVWLTEVGHALDGVRSQLERPPRV